VTGLSYLDRSFGGTVLKCKGRRLDALGSDTRSDLAPTLQQYFS
jgi:hypothetical protein